ncbi:hypothetical protein STEG23_008973, partial [Scotinomys teguina]
DRMKPTVTTQNQKKNLCLCLFNHTICNKAPRPFCTSDFISQRKFRNSID